MRTAGFSAKFGKWKSTARKFSATNSPTTWKIIPFLFRHSISRYDQMMGKISKLSKLSSKPVVSKASPTDASEKVSSKLLLHTESPSSPNLLPGRRSSYRLRAIFRRLLPLPVSSTLIWFEDRTL